MTARTLWITYAWDDNVDGDFDYLSSELATKDLEIRYDRVSLVPGQRLWEQIADKIADSTLDAWAYLVTPSSLKSQACREELAYALDRALQLKGTGFPIIGIVHGVRFDQIPSSLKIRLCVSLEDPGWREQVRAGVQMVPPPPPEKTPSPYFWRIHRAYLGSDHTNAFEIRPRFGSIARWAIAVPKDGPQPLHWGLGPSGGNPVQSVLMGGTSGDISIRGEQMSYFSAEQPSTPSTSIYLVFSNGWPSKIRTGRFVGSESSFDSEVVFTPNPPTA